MLGVCLGDWSSHEGRKLIDSSPNECRFLPATALKCVGCWYIAFETHLLKTKILPSEANKTKTFAALHPEKVDQKNQPVNDCLKGTNITENMLEEKDHSTVFHFKSKLLKTYVCITLKEKK